MKVLGKINSPLDIKKLSERDLLSLADETREFIIENVDKTGGHLAPSLGVVELTIALMKVYDLPKDKLVWDVGHQAYAHKIYTGRREVFNTNRQLGGISGFIKPSESEYDSFGVGHASTSISAGFGFVMARDILNEKYNVISVIGDGSITGGLAFEGLNNAGASGKNFLVILNDNEMSISKNVGAISKYTTSVLSDPTYNKFKNDIWNFAGKYKVGKQIRQGLSRIEDSVKTLLTPGILFEKLGFNYIGPVNGHNLPLLIKVLENIKNKVSGPVFLHVVTEKGKGYKPAEQDVRGTYHGVGPGILEPAKTKDEKPKYQDIFGKTLCDIAERNKKIVAITAAMAVGTGLADFCERYPDRFFDVGIAEEHAVTFAAALSLKGLKPVVAIYSTFLQRSLDQIIHDCALQELDMIFAIDRAGLVGEDGPTHHGVFDISYLRMIPNLIIMSPANENELADMLEYAAANRGVFAIRYPRGSGPGCEDIAPDAKRIALGKGELVRKGSKTAVLCAGNITNSAIQAAEILKNDNIDAAIYNMKFVKPLDISILDEAAEKFDNIITVEENSLAGGFGSAVLEYYNSEAVNVNLKRIGIPDKFVEHGKVEELLKILRLDPSGLAEQIADFVKKT
ncbi:MAG: 1-deoxy-D-xylulose-5-phosphate synthase [Candidatus Delongbacteria bacterium]|nr:1-deoxy-D-xylulose-5-phosphate synthase [Candidatus Delongbacteria bacterium]